jgi:hypothetical protein
MNCPDSDIADGFRALAADCFDLAEQVVSVPVVQQQQQMQPMAKPKLP